MSIDRGMAMVRGLGTIILLLYLAVTPVHAEGKLIKAPIPSKRLIVFVHGFIAGADSTWKNEQTGVLWPALLHAKGDETFERADVYVYSYFSGLGAGSSKITDIADKMAAELEDKQGLNIGSYESVLFVAHSLGGIVVRKYLLDQSHLPNGVLDNDRVKGIFLFGTPMTGSGVANIASNIFRSKTLWQMAQSKDPDSFLNVLRADWIKAGLGTKIKSNCAFETTGAFDLFFWDIKAVQPSSVEPLCNAGFTGMPNHNHHQIVKPANAMAYPHVLLRRWYLKTFGDEKLEASNVAIAACAIDKYGKSHIELFSRELFKLSIEHHVTLTLPKDWSAEARSFVSRGAPPKVIGIHYSCFENGTGDRFIEEGRIDFNKFLSSFAATDVKIVAYSRAFYDRFIEENITRANRKAFVDTGRLKLLGLQYGREIGPAQAAEFGKLVSDALSGVR